MALQHALLSTSYENTLLYVPVIIHKQCDFIAMQMEFNISNSKYSCSVNMH